MVFGAVTSFQRENPAGNNNRVFRVGAHINLDMSILPGRTARATFKLVAKA